jgi:predicted nuclease of predicted toxin-antitoxin system
MRILLDMNLSPRWVGVLLHAGFETQHWSDVGRPDASDAEIMSFPAKSGAVLVTHDLDFSAILAATHGAKPSVVQIRARNVTPEFVSQQVVAALKEASVDLESGALLTIDVDRARLRLLPLLREE